MAAELKTVLPTIPLFQDLVETRPDPDSLLESAEEAARSLLNRKDPVEARNAMLAFQQRLLEWQTCANFEKVMRARGQQTEEMKAERLYFSKYLNVPHEAENLFYNALLRSPYERMAHAESDRDLWARARNWRKFEERVPVGLFAREKELKQRLLLLKPSFYNLADEVSAGKELLIRESSELRTELLRVLCEDLHAQSDARTEAFLELFAVRREIARSCSFENYADYSAARKENRSFSRQEYLTFVSAFRHRFQSIIQEIIHQRNRRFGVELRRMSDYFLLAPQGEPILQITQNETIRIFKEILNKLLGEEGNIISVLLEKGYVNYSPGISDRLSQAAVLFPSQPAAFLNLPLQNELIPAVHLFLQSGEALADISAMLNYHILGSAKQDDFTRKISSLFFLRLAGEKLDLLYGPNSELAQDLRWLQMMIKIPLNLALFEMEDRVYSSSEVPDLKELKREWSALRARWMPDLILPNDGYFSDNLGWMYFLSGREEVFSDISLPLALVSVLSTDQVGRDKRGLSSVFNSMLLTNPGSPIQERLQTSGVGNPMLHHKMQKAAFMICDLLEL